TTCISASWEPSFYAQSMWRFPLWGIHHQSPPPGRKAAGRCCVSHTRGECELVTKSVPNERHLNRYHVRQSAFSCLRGWMSSMQHNGLDPSRGDDDIVAAACTHPEAFAPLYEKYSVPIYRWFYRETGNAEVSADFAAQVFAQALQNLHRYKPQQSASF